MHPRKRMLAALNLLGGPAILGSYVWGLAGHPGSADDVWGGVPDGLRPLYTVTMLLATAGYFAFTSFVFLRLPPDETRIAGGRYGYGSWSLLYALILVPSALWMPLTFAMLDQPGPGLWLAIRAVLFAVGAGSLGLVAALLTVQPREPALWHRLALLGAIAFSFQTAVLDALVWPAYFPAG